MGNLWYYMHLFGKKHSNQCSQFLPYNNIKRTNEKQINLQKGNYKQSRNQLNEKQKKWGEIYKIKKPVLREIQ